MGGKPLNESGSSITNGTKILRRERLTFTPISTASQTRTLYLTEVSTGTVTPYAIDTGATEILIEFLVADSEYKLFITSVCADLTECSSAELLIKTLK